MRIDADRGDSEPSALSVPGHMAALAWARRLAERPAAALTLAKQVLAESEELPLTESLANEQRRFQEIAGTEDALARMEALQALYDAGESRPATVEIEPFRS